MTTPAVYDIDYNGLGFYHSFCLSNSKRSVDLWDFDESDNEVIIKGQWNHNPIAKELLDALDFSESTVLDVGCNDGFYSFLAEKKKNKVTALDVYDSKPRQYVAAYLNSNLEFIHKNVNGIYGWNRKFDVCIVGDILLHLENPLGLLRLVRLVTAKKIVLISDYVEGTEATINLCLEYYHTPYRFTLSALKCLLLMAGFKNISVTKLLRIGSDTKKIDYAGRDLCVLSADIDETYQFNKLFSSYCPTELIP